MLLDGYVLWRELKEVANLPNDYINKIPEDSKKKIGNFIYIKKGGIPDILNRYESESCTNLDKMVPLSLLARQFNLTSSKITKLSKTKNCIVLYDIKFFKIPDDLFLGCEKK